MNVKTLVALLEPYLRPAGPPPPGMVYRLLTPNATYGGITEYLRPGWPGQVVAVTSSPQAFTYLEQAGCYAVLGSPGEVHVPPRSISALIVEYEDTALMTVGRDKKILRRFLPALAPGAPVLIHTMRERLPKLADDLAGLLDGISCVGALHGAVYVAGRYVPGAGGDRREMARKLRAFAQSEEPRFGPGTPHPAVPVPDGPFRTRGGFMPAVLLAEAAEHGVFSERYRRELFFPAWQRRLVTLMPPRHGHLALLVAGGSLDGAVITTPSGERLLLKGLVRKRRDRAEDEEGRRVETEAFESEVNAVDLDTGRYLVML